MSKRLIITEEEKEKIKSLYGLISEQRISDLPQNQQGSTYTGPKPNIELSPKPKNLTTTLSSQQQQQVKNMTRGQNDTKPKNNTNASDNLVSVLYNARNISWESGVVKSLFNDKDSIEELSTTLVTWVKKNKYDDKLFKASVTLLFRESKATPISYLSPKEIFGYFSNMFGGDSSQGYAQIKPSTAKKYGINMDNVYDMYGSLDAIYKILNVNYQNAKEYYNGGTLNIFDSNKILKSIPAIDGDAALHISLAAHNAGEEIINNWCQTNVQGIANLCTEKSRKPYGDDSNIVAVTDTQKKILNYFPNIGGVHEYMVEIKKCFDSLSSLPKIMDSLKSI